MDVLERLHALQEQTHDGWFNAFQAAVAAGEADRIVHEERQRTRNQAATKRWEASLQQLKQQGLLERKREDWSHVIPHPEKRARKEGRKVNRGEMETYEKLLSDVNMVLYRLTNVALRRLSH